VHLAPLLLFVSMLLPLPVDTPIPCVICAGTAAQSTATFSGTVSASSAASLSVYDFTSRRLMIFEVPPSLAGAPPGTYTRVTYSSSHGRNVAVAVVVERRATIPGRNALQ
jgi:hypothetical protein